MIAYNFRAAGNGAGSQAAEGRGKLAPPTPASAFLAASHGYRAGQARADEQQLVAHLAASLGGSFPHYLLISYYVALKANPFVVLTGREGAGKAALVGGFAAALFGAESNQLVTIGSSSWAQHSGQSSYYRGVHERFGSLQFLETLQDAAAPENSGKVYLVLLKGLTLDEIDYYFSQLLHVGADGCRRLALPGVPDRKQPVLPSNIFITATLHIPRTTSPIQHQVLDQAGQITLHSGHPRTVPPVMPPPVGYQRLLLSSAIHDPHVAHDQLGSILGYRTLQALGPSRKLVEQLPESVLLSQRIRPTLLTYVANSFDKHGQGLFDASDQLRNAQIALDDQLLQRITGLASPSTGPLRRRLAQLSASGV